MSNIGVGNLPAPIPRATVSIHDLVVADVLGRKGFGLAKYSTYLQAGNGRDGLQDAYEEILDLAAYIRKEIEERNQREAMSYSRFTHRAKVRKFSETFDHPIAVFPIQPSIELRKLRADLLEEEYLEWRNAVAAGDIVETADGQADMLYIAHGTLLSYGLESSQIWDLGGATIDEVMADYLDAERRPHELVQIRIGKLLNTLIQLIEQDAVDRQIPLGECFDAVHISNMSKMPVDGVPLKNAAGKTIKPDTFIPVDLVTILRAHGHEV